MSNPIELDKQVVSKANDRQVGGTHYRSQYQHWDLATDTMMRHLEGAATKYLSRFGNKQGEPASKDLNKVEHYLEKLIEVFKTNPKFGSLAAIQTWLSVDPMPFVEQFLNTLQGPPSHSDNQRAIRILASWWHVDQLTEALTLVRGLKTYHLEIEQRAAAAKGMD